MLLKMKKGDIISIKKTSKVELGIGTIELVLLAPIFLILIFGGIELASALRQKAALNTLARSMTAVAYRDCTWELYRERISDVDIDRIERCLISDVQQRVMGILGGSEWPELKVVSKVFRWNPVGIGGRPELVSEVELNEGDHEYSRITVDEFDPRRHERRAQLLKEHAVLVYTELIFPFESIVPSFSQFIGGSDSQFYVTAVF